MPRRTALTRNRSNKVGNKVHLVCDHEWTFSELASIACLSKYHFLRVFQAVLNETLGRFVHRIRLERAARFLIYNRGTSVTDVAHARGFGSSQTHTRAFRRRFCSTPLGVSSLQHLRRRATASRGKGRSRNVQIRAGTPRGGAFDGASELPRRVRTSPRSLQ